MERNLSILNGRPFRPILFWLKKNRPPIQLHHDRNHKIDRGKREQGADARNDVEEAFEEKGAVEHDVPDETLRGNPCVQPGTAPWSLRGEQPGHHLLVKIGIRSRGWIFHGNSQVVYWMGLLTPIPEKLVAPACPPSLAATVRTNESVIIFVYRSRVR